METKVRIKNQLSKFIFYWLPPVIWGLVIFSFSSFTTPRVSEIHWRDFFMKKLAHVIEYGFLGILLFRAYLGYGMKKKKALINSLFVCIVYAFTDEFHQSFTPGRESRMRDVLIDSGGSGAFLYLTKNIIPKTTGKIKDLAKLAGLV